MRRAASSSRSRCSNRRSCWRRGARRRSLEEGRDGGNGPGSIPTCVSSFQGAHPLIAHQVRESSRSSQETRRHALACQAHWRYCKSQPMIDRTEGGGAARAECCLNSGRTEATIPPSRSVLASGGISASVAGKIFSIGCGCCGRRTCGKDRLLVVERHPRDFRGYVEFLLGFVTHGQPSFLDLYCFNDNSYYPDLSIEQWS